MSDIVTPVVARIVNRILTVPNIGLVHPEDPFNRTDLQPLLVSSVGGVPTTRAWWVSGPSLDSGHATVHQGGYIERDWTYRIYGVDGMPDAGGSIATLRTLANAVSDALDVDRTLGGTCSRTRPCEWAEPEIRQAVVLVAWVCLTKTVTTLTTP